MKVLVTGGNGFIGRHVAYRLMIRNAYPVILDRHQSIQDEYPWSVVLRRRFYGDIKDAEAVLEAVSQCDGVIHLAAILGTQETIENPEPVTSVNVGGSLNVFRACRQHDKPCVYINVGNYWMNNPYSITKSTAARFAMMYNRERGTRIAVVRGLNVYGPGQKALPVRKIVPNLILPALRGEDITIYGDGNQVMDMIYVEDIAEILVRALLEPHGVYDAEFQAGCSLDTTVNELADRVLEITGSSSKVVHVPMRPGETPGAIVKADRRAWNLEKLNWGFDNFTPLCEGLRKTVEWYKGQESPEAEDEEQSTAGESDPMVASGAVESF